MAWRASCGRRTAVSLWIRDDADRLVGQRRGHRRAGLHARYAHAHRAKAPPTSPSVLSLAGARCARPGAPTPPRRRSDASLGADVTAVHTSRPATPSGASWRIRGLRFSDGARDDRRDETARSRGVAWSTTTSPSAESVLRTRGAGRAMWVPTRGG